LAIEIHPGARPLRLRHVTAVWLSLASSAGASPYDDQLKEQTFPRVGWFFGIPIWKRIESRHQPNGMPPAFSHVPCLVASRDFSINTKKVSSGLTTLTHSHLISSVICALTPGPEQHGGPISDHVMKTLAVLGSGLSLTSAMELGQVRLGSRLRRRARSSRPGQIPRPVHHNTDLFQHHESCCGVESRAACAWASSRISGSILKWLSMGSLNVNSGDPTARRLSAGIKKTAIFTVKRNDDRL
jgi:hypothetical protein